MPRRHDIEEHIQDQHADSTRKHTHDYKFPLRHDAGIPIESLLGFRQVAIREKGRINLLVVLDNTWQILAVAKFNIFEHYSYVLVEDIVLYFKVLLHELLQDFVSCNLVDDGVRIQPLYLLINLFKGPGPIRRKTYLILGFFGFVRSCFLVVELYDYLLGSFLLDRVTQSEIKTLH